MFFISPIKAVYSIKFYLQTLKEPLWKAFLFFVYLFALGAIFLALYIPIKMGPAVDEGLVQVAEIMPDITISEGVINVNNNKKLVIDDKILQGRKIIFDTGSTEPGYPTQMNKENVVLYVNKNSIYMSYNGKFQENTLQDDMDFHVSKQILLDNKTQIANTINYFLIVVFIGVLGFRMLALAVLALITAFLISMAFKLELSFKKLLILALYMQAPIVIIDLISFALPIHVLGMSALIALVLFVIYTNLIFSALRSNTKQIVNNTNEGGEQ